MFPGITIRNPGSIDYTFKKDQYVTPKNLGVVVTRTKHQKSRRFIVLKWGGDSALREYGAVTELSDLLSMFDTYTGNSFTFTDPNNNIEHIVPFSGPIKYKAIQTGSGLYEVEVVLEEV